MYNWPTMRELRDNLRDFPKTKERLFAPGEGYCCLGVACNLAGMQDDQLTNAQVIYFTKRQIENNDFSPNGAVSDMDDAPSWLTPDRQVALTVVNDATDGWDQVICLLSAWLDEETS